MAASLRIAALRQPRLLLAVVLVAAAVAAPTWMAPAHADVLSTVTQNLLPGLAAATDAGPAPQGQELALTISLDRPDPAGEQAFIAAAHDPANPQYGQFLTPAGFAERFGVPDAQRTAVNDFLSGGGLTVDSVSVAGDVFSVHGTVAQIDALMHTAIHSFTIDGTPFLANTAAPMTPASLSIANVVGLNTLQHYTLPARTPAQGTCFNGTCIGGTTPQDLWTAYEQPARYQGQRRGLAVFGEGATDSVISDLRQFEQHFGLPTVPVTVKHPKGDSDFTDTSGSVEWNIDTQASSGMAPQASGLTLYFGHDLSDADVTNVFSQFTDDASGPLEASASYGECETIPVVSPIAGQPLLNPSLPAGQGLGNNNDYTLNQITRQAAAEGKTIFVSTGDTGSSCPVVYAAVIGAGNGVLNQGVPITNSPASLPYVTAVGGTVLYTDGSGNRTREYGWAYSGGGSTLFTPAPDYQRGTPGLSVDCVTDLLTVCRGIADVAAQSGDVISNGYDIVESGSFTEGGGAGTSLSAPLWQGMWARVQSASARPAGNGFANYSLYRVGKNPVTEARDYFDITSTDTATGLPAGNGAYLTTPGWDYVTGWGSPRVAGLICDITGSGC